MDDMAQIEGGFAKACNLLFGTPLGGMAEYGDWLSQNMPRGKAFKAGGSGKNVLLPDYSVFKFLPKERVVGLERLPEVAMKKIGADCADLRQIAKKAAGIAFFCGEIGDGQSSNNIESNLFVNLNSSYRCIDVFYAKECGFSIFCDYSDFTYGSYRTMYSHFTMNCYHSNGLNACFEMDGCNNCSRSMFCHNCENVNDSLFCFNARNLKYAVCNREVGREEYLRIRGMLCAYIVKNLKERKRLDIGIYSLPPRA